MTNRCVQCLQYTAHGFACATCYMVYCSEECQQYDWNHNNHAAICNQIEIVPQPDRRTLVELVYLKSTNITANDTMNDQPLLIFASEYGLQSMVDHLLNVRNADVNIQHKMTGQTALMVAARQKHGGTLETSILLIQHPKIRLDIRDNENMNAFQHACMAKNHFLIWYLLSLELKPPFDPFIDPIPYQYAQDDQTIDIMFNKGLDINEQDPETGDTAVIMHMRSNRWHLIDNLFKKGATIPSNIALTIPMKKKEFQFTGNLHSPNLIDADDVMRLLRNIKAMLIDKIHTALRYNFDNDYNEEFEQWCLNITYQLDGEKTIYTLSFVEIGEFLLKFPDFLSTWDLKYPQNDTLMADVIDTMDTARDVIGHFIERLNNNNTRASKRDYAVENDDDKSNAKLARKRTQSEYDMEYSESEESDADDLNRREWSLRKKN